MQRVTITYHMSARHEIAETCITIPMEDRLAAELLERQDTSALAQIGDVNALIQSLAFLQGYYHAEFICAERAKDINLQ